MRTRYLVTFAAATIIFLSAALQAQTSNGSTARPTGIPKISCAVTSSHDSLFFRGNDYLPNEITVTVTVTNISAGQDTAKNIQVCMVQDTRFNVDGAPCTDPFAIPVLLKDSSVSVTFRLRVASERSNDGIDIIRAVAIASNGANSACEKDIWVEHEYFPGYQISCTRDFSDIVFDDGINDYKPNPFRILVDIRNIRDGNSDSSTIQYLGTRGVSVDPSNNSVRQLGTIVAGGISSVTYDLGAIKRNNDTTVTICFQVQGKGGYKRKNYIDSCCVTVFIPQAKQPVYELVCKPQVDSIMFVAHKYTPDPFTYEVTVTNNGTSTGRDVVVQILPPPSVQLAPGETNTRTYDSLLTGQSKTMTWSLKPAIRFQRDTVRICVKVTDRFDNSASTCCPVIIDSIRSAKFAVECTVPDSVRVDLAKGIYNPDVFQNFFRVTNIGSDYADSVKATIVIQTPDVIGIDDLGSVPARPFSPIKRKSDFTTPSDDKLDVGNSFTFDWTLQALPRAVSGYVTFKFKAEALNAMSVESECRVYIPKLDAPDLEVTCSTDPIDSLHFDPVSGGYTPAMITFTARITNPGGGLAKNVMATLALPPRMLLAPGEKLTKPALVGTPATNDLGPADIAIIVWKLIPLERRDQGADVAFRVDVSADNVAGRFPSLCTVFVPALPYTVSLVIGNGVGYFGQIVNIPIYVDNPEGKSIKSIDFGIDYNLIAPSSFFMSPLVSYIGHVVDNTLLPASNWTSSSTATSSTHLHFSASTNNLPLQYEDKPLVVFQFRVEFGLGPDQLRSAYTDLYWSRPLLDSIKINNGSIYPRIADGSITVTGDCMRVLDASDRFGITQNKPNPFNPSTTFEFGVPEESPVRITVFDALGRTVKVLVDETKQAGTYSVTFNADNIPSGVYYYRMETPKYSQVMKMILAR